MPGKENPWANDAPQSRLDLNGRLENPGPNARSPVGRRLGLPEFSGSSFPRIQKAMAALRVSPSPSMMVATGDKYCNEAPGMFPWLGGYDALSLCDLLYAETQGSWGFVATDFLSRHLEITSAHRAILVNWLVEVDCDSLRWNSMGASSASQLDSPRVLSSAVRLLDQFLARTKIPVRRSNLQLVSSPPSLQIAGSLWFYSPCPGRLNNCVFVHRSASHATCWLPKVNLPTVIWGRSALSTPIRCALKPSQRKRLGGWSWKFWRHLIGKWQAQCGRCPSTFWSTSSRYCLACSSGSMPVPNQICQAADDFVYGV